MDSTLNRTLGKKLFGNPDFFIEFGSPIDANTFGIFGFGWSWAQYLIKILVFFKFC
jgi:hypothetical protein